MEPTTCTTSTGHVLRLDLARGVLWIDGDPLTVATIPASEIDGFCDRHGVLCHFVAAAYRVHPGTVRREPEPVEFEALPKGLAVRIRVDRPTT